MKKEECGHCVVALLTGRGGSSLKGKNLIDVCGKPVMAYPASAGRSATSVSAWYCSSDDNAILDVAASYGYKRILRPADISGSSAQHSDAISHAISEMSKDGCVPDIVVVLLANNVSVKPEWIDDCIKMMEQDTSITSVVPVYIDNDHHQLRAKRLSEGVLIPFISSSEKKVSSNRQDLEACYFLCHNFWCMRTSAIISSDGFPPWTFMGSKVVPYVVDKSVGIHDVHDVDLARQWVDEHIGCGGKEVVQ